MIHCYEDLDSEPHGVTFIKHDELMLIQFAGCIKAMNEAGDIVYSIETPSPMYQLCLAGPGKTVIGIFIEHCVKLYNAADGKLTSTVKLDCQKFNAGSIVFGVEGINAGNVIDKIEKVPRGIRGEKSSKDMASSRNLVSTIGAQASPTMVGRNQVSGRVSVPCWHATPVANGQFLFEEDDCHLY